MRPSDQLAVAAQADLTTASDHNDTRRSRIRVQLRGFIPPVFRSGATAAAQTIRAKGERFIEKVRAAGLYLGPPEKALVLATGAAPGHATATPHTNPGREEVTAAPLRFHLHFTRPKTRSCHVTQDGTI
jgi:hypothetical protein